MIGEYFIYLDVCAIALFLGMIFTVIYRKSLITSRGKFFLAMLIVGLISGMADILSINSNLNSIVVYISNIVYLASRAFIALSYCLYMISLADNWHKYKNGPWRILLLFIPFVIVVGLLISNYWTHWVFDVSDGKYIRGMLINYGIMYICTFVYSLIALIYFIIYREFFNRAKKFAIIQVYPILIIALLLQSIRTNWLIEIFATAFSSLILMNLLERPEEIYEPEIGLKKYTAFQEDSYKAARTKKVISLVFVKIVNDVRLTPKMNYNEQISLRKSIGNLLKSTAKDFSLKGDFYYLGVGEYAIALVDLKNDNSESYAMTLRRRLNVPIKADFGIVDLYSNVALVHCPEDISNSETAINFVEKFVHIPGILDTVLDLSKIPNRRDFEISMNMSSIIKKGLMDKKFDVYFQPIYSVKEESFTRAEALLRLYDDKYGEIEPKDFIPEAERNGTIHKIGDIVFDKVCEFIASSDFKKLGLEKIEINLSTVQCMHEDLPIHIMDAVKRYGIHPSAINLEITESADAYSRKMMEDNIKVLKELGFSFSLDDYGTGYSNLDNVTQMPVDAIKLDRSLAMSDNPEIQVMFSHSLKLVKDLKKQVVIEGVENEDILNMFETSLCDYIQGYYFSKPLPKEDFINFLYEKKGLVKEKEVIENEQMEQ